MRSRRIVKSLVVDIQMTQNMRHPTIKTEHYNINLLDKLAKGVPEFVSAFEEDDGGVFPMFGDFGRFILKNLDYELFSKKVV